MTIDCSGMAKDILALGLHHADYAIPTELMAPLVLNAVEVVRTMMTDKNAEDGLRWSLTLISKMRGRTILGREGAPEGHLSVAQWQACNGVIEHGRRHALHFAAVLVHPKWKSGGGESHGCRSIDLPTDRDNFTTAVTSFTRDTLRVFSVSVQMQLALSLPPGRGPD